MTPTFGRYELLARSSPLLEHCNGMEGREFDDCKTVTPTGIFKHVK